MNVGSGIPCHFEDAFTYKSVEMLDLPEEDLAARLSECAPFISEAMVGGRVLVHCNAGVSRSAAVVIAFLVTECDMSLAEAVGLAKAKRPASAPNPGFMAQLRQLEKDRSAKDMK